MGTTAEKLDKIKSTKAAIKAAIIAKGQPVADGDTFASYADKIGAIQVGPDTSDATATAGDLLEGKTAYGANGKFPGTIPSKSAVDLSASGDTVTVPAGHYPAQVSKAVAAAAQATPTIEVSSSGLITASATQAAGYVAGGTKSATKQLTTQGAQTITPGTSNKTIASGRYLTGTQTIKGDADLKAANIKKGINIFDVVGTLSALTDPAGTIYKNTSASFSFTVDLTGKGILFLTAGGEGSSFRSVVLTVNSGDRIPLCKAHRAASYACILFEQKTSTTVELKEAFTDSMQNPGTYTFDDPANVSMSGESGANGCVAIVLR